MTKLNKNEIFLISLTFIFIFHHLIVQITEHFLIQFEKTLRMKEFNILLDNNSVSLTVLKSLKILIHNYESLPDKSILNSRNENKLQETVRTLKIEHQEIFLKNTTTLNLLVFGSTLMPCFAFLIKKFIKRKVKINKAT